MIGLLRSETRKLLTTQVWFWLLLGALGLTALNVVGQFLGDGAGNDQQFRLATPAGLRNLFAAPANGALFVAVLGVIGITAEYRHLTVTPTYLTTPRRNRVVLAKLVVYATAGLIYAIVGVGLVLAMALPWLPDHGATVSLGSDSIPLVLLAAVLVVAIYGVLGVGVGALIRNQVAAVVIVPIYLAVVEPLLSVIPGVKHAYKWFPGAAAQSVTQISRPNTTLLQPWQGGLLLLGYGLALATLGALLSIRRDVT